MLCLSAETVSTQKWSSQASLVRLSRWSPCQRLFRLCKMRNVRLRALHLARLVVAPVFCLRQPKDAESRSRRQTRHGGQSRCALCGFRCLLLQQQQKNASTAPRTKYFIFFSRESLSKKLASKSLLTDAKMLRKEKLENVLLGGMNCHSIPFTSRVPARRPNVRVTATKPNNFATDRKTKSNSGNY